MKHVFNSLKNDVKKFKFVEYKKYLEGLQLSLTVVEEPEFATFFFLFNSYISK